jgi:urease accessory protein
MREPHAIETPRAGWQASLDLQFAARADRTYLARRAHHGPLVVQRPFYPEGGVCHTYIVHPPGGIVGGDRLDLSVRATEGAHALLTTPAATKFYRSNGRIAEQTQVFKLEQAALEWLPQETILYPRASARIATRVQLCKRSRFIGWEIVCYGRPASALAYEEGEAAQDFELWLEGAPLLIDRLRLNGASDPVHGAYGLAGQPVLATLLAYPATGQMLDEVRAIATVPGLAVALERNAMRAAAHSAQVTLTATGALNCAPAIHFAATRVDDVIVARAIGQHVDQVRAVMEVAWRCLRPHVMGRAAVAPRIWST